MIDPEIEAIAAFLYTNKVAMTAADPLKPDCPIVATNSAFQDLTGYPPNMIEGKNCRFLQGGFIDRAERQQIRGALQSLKPHLAILLNFKRSGEPFNNLLMLEPLKLPSGRTIFLSCNFGFDLSTELDVISDEANRRYEHLDRIMRKTGIPSQASFNALRARAAASVGMVRHYAYRH